MIRSRGRHILAIVCLAAAPKLAMAQGEEARGVTFGVTYTTEAFSVVRGGVRGDTSAYLGSLVPTLTLDLGRMGFGRGQFYVSAQALRGSGISGSRVGAVQALSNLEEQRFGKFIEAWYADAYCGGNIRLKAGRQYADADFGVVENGADFLNSSYGLNPTTPMPTYPAPELGVSIWVAPAPWISWGFGAYQGGDLEPQSEGGSSVQRRPFTIFEARLEPFRKSSNWNGSYHVGMWRQSRAAWLATAEPGAPVRNYGVYATADQWFRRSPSGDHRGPGLFFQWGWTPADRNEVAGYLGGGVAYAGLLPGRRKDSAGVGVTRAKLGPARAETIVEWFYKCRISPHLTLQPDLQWVMHPAGTGRGALVAGVRMEMGF
ncbi:MAG TPA: carbohydrate porin [Bryobacteraceae bacterium]|nr:carbohydrate porin [Bryobacteraceae bacterium]